MLNASEFFEDVGNYLEGEKRSLAKEAAAFGLSTLLLVSSVAAKAADSLESKIVRKTEKGVVKRITDSPVYESNPSVSEKNITWVVSDEKNRGKYIHSGMDLEDSIYKKPMFSNHYSEIEVYNREKKIKERITDNHHPDFLPTIRKGKLAWLDPGGANFYDLESEEMEEASLSQSIIPDRINLDPNPNDWFSWEDTEKAFFRNLSTGEQFKVPAVGIFSGYRFDKKLDTLKVLRKIYSPNDLFMSARGRFEENRAIETDDRNIFSVDMDYIVEHLDALLENGKLSEKKVIEQGIYKQITGLEVKQEGYISVSPSRIVWQGKEEGDWDIFSYNPETEEVVKLTSSSADQIQPEVYKDSVVWSDFRDGNQEIYLFEFTDGGSK